MIKRKLKICKICKKESYLFSKKRCLECTKIQDNYKIKKESNTEKERRKKYKSLRVAYIEKIPYCEVCGKQGNTKTLTIHHRSGRDGDNLFKHFLVACLPCHVKIENNPDWAYENGYSISRIN